MQADFAALFAVQTAGVLSAYRSNDFAVNTKIKSADFEFFINGAALHRNAAGLANHSLDLAYAQALGRFGTGHVVDRFLDNGTIDIVCAKLLRDLGRFYA